jgi:ABC-type branched-subunit amino acid transport system ATPase component/MFS family permease
VTVTGDEPVVAAEDTVARVESMRDELRAEARARLGVTGERDQPAPLRAVLTQHGVPAYPLFALGLLAIVDTFQGYAFGVLAPDISATLGVGKGAIAAAIAIKTLAHAVGPLPIAALAHRRARRALLIVVTGVAWSVVAMTTGLVTAMAGLAAVLVVDGLTTASTSALHTPVLLDTYPPPARVRVLSFYQGANSAGNIAAPLLVALLTSAFDLTWRGVFVVMGAMSLVAALAALRLRDPGFGRWDTEAVRDTVRMREGGESVAATEALRDEEVELGFFEVVRRLLLIPTMRRLLFGQAVFGMLLIPYQTFLAFFLEERWGLAADGRGLFLAYLATVSVVALAAYGRRGEALFQRDPRYVIELASLLLIAAVVLIALAALAPAFALMVALFGAAAGLTALLGPSMAVAVLSLIPARMRPHAAALLGLALGVGGFGGALMLGGVDRRFGVAGSIVSFLVPGVFGALIIRSAGPLIGADLDRMIDDTIEDEEIKQLQKVGRHLPMLRCHGVDFSYGPVQVLFDVHFTVDDGELVALLGTNGAGKSTLLKAISGIGLPTAGSVRFRGADITYLDAERRVGLGITQIPGGRAVFGPLTVVENLRLFGYSLGRNARSVDDAVDQSLATFPRLAERRNQKAVTLSGGEQQMLALSKAFILKPRLLLIDELSLGLAPVVVGNLLEMVKEINRSGTAVVLVEQSVNIALSVADHAYFMEKGEIRFDGSSRDLLQRGDLLRAVFLEGTAGALRGAPNGSG